MFARVGFLPKRGVPGSLLTWVIAVMVYLTALALFAGLTLHASVGAWRDDVARSLSVQIAGGNRQQIAVEVEAALGVLRAEPGVERAEPLGAPEIAALLEPWLGAGNITDDLPVPGMVDVVLAAGATVDVAALAARLAAVAPHARLDDHQQWLGRIIDLAVSLQIIAIGIIVLISLITMAIVVFATRSGLTAHRNIIEVVHLIGARDATIAAQFQWRFLAVGLRGALIGLLVAVLTIAGLWRLTLDLQAAFLPKMEITAAIAGGLAALPPAIALLTMVTAYVTVRRTLARMV